MKKKTPAVLCPYCGNLQRKLDRCDDCGGLLDEHSRTATQIAMGPWYIRNKDKPFHPGCSYDVLRKQIAAGKVTDSAVLRGPTTSQFWQVARRVPGVAHLVGYCHACHKKIADPSAKQCEHCGAAFGEPAQRNELGLRYTTAAAAEAAQSELRRAQEIATAKAQTKPTLTPPPGAAEQPQESSSTPPPPPPAQATGADLLESVLSSVTVSPSASDEAVASQEPTSALDNAPNPSAAIDDVSPTAPAPKKRDTSMWLLITMNIVVLGALVWFFFLRKP